MGAAMLFVLSIYIEERDYIGDNLHSLRSCMFVKYQLLRASFIVDLIRPMFIFAYVTPNTMIVQSQ